MEGLFGSGRHRCTVVSHLSRLGVSVRPLSSSSWTVLIIKEGVKSPWKMAHGEGRGSMLVISVRGSRAGRGVQVILQTCGGGGVSGVNE